MLDIKILGTGCYGCLKTEQTVMAALQALGISEAKVELVSDEHTIEYGLRSERAPGLLINGLLAWSGSVPTQEMVEGLLKEAYRAETA